MTLLKTTALTAAVLSAASLAQAAPFTTEVHMDTRLRYEAVDQSNALKDADSGSFRFRPRVEIGNGTLDFLAEAEVTAEVGKGFNSTRNGETDRSVVADPQSKEINRLQLSYTHSGEVLTGSKVTVGRQEINLGNQRFVGAVAWRQNEQTFDAVRVQLKPISAIELDYAYVNQVNTIFGSEEPVPSIAARDTEYETDIHLLNLTGVVPGEVKVNAYGYWMGFDDVAGKSNQTFGLSAAHDFGLIDARLEYANQSDYDTQPLDYSADYWHATLGLETESKIRLAAGYELLGSDDGAIGFQTPLATLHKFNGAADTFLNTPANGLQDAYITAETPLKFIPGKFGVEAHKFDSDEGSQDYGFETTGTLVVPIKALPGLKGIVKYTHYEADDGPYVDTDKLWVQMDFSL